MPKVAEAKVANFCPRHSIFKSSSYGNTGPSISLGKNICSIEFLTSQSQHQLIVYPNLSGLVVLGVSDEHNPLVEIYVFPLQSQDLAFPHRSACQVIFLTGTQNYW